MGKVILNEVYNTRLSLVESVNEPGVLATYAGTFAEYAVQNKNGRLYGEAPWVHALEEDEDVKRALDGKLMYGELDHPTDYLDVKIDKTALCVTKLDINRAKGTIDGELKVLDTPAGQILNTLIRFGSRLGVSSRASGELDRNGKVIPETFKFVTFDIVTNPSNAGALPHLVESASEQEKPLKDILLEAIDTADLSQLKIITDMSSTLEEEMATEVINKVEDRKAALLKEHSNDQDEDVKALREDVSGLKVAVDGLVHFIRETLSASKTDKTESSKELVESDKPGKARSRLPRKLVESRKETTVAAVRVDSPAPDSTERRVEHLVKSNRSK